MSKTLREFVDQLEREKNRNEISRSKDNSSAETNDQPISMDSKLSQMRTQQILDHKKKLMKKPGLKSES